jgi:hypothetical protein
VQTTAQCAEELLEQLQHLAAQPSQEEEFQQRMENLRAPSDQRAAETAAVPSQSVDERFAQVQRLIQGGSTPAKAGPSTSPGTHSGAVACTSSGLAATLGALQAQTLAGGSTGAW